MGAWNEIKAGLDPARQLPAVEETRSAVVSAGAGSGKTRVLAVRYLHLVKERGVPPDRILCMTFTKKAAAEMSERIRAMLVACAADDDDFKAALEAFPSSRVSTLDSFCSEVARDGCARWGVPPDFAVDKDPGDLKGLAIEFLLERRDDPVAASFIAASGFEKAAEALVALAGGREGLIATDRPFDADGQAAALVAFLADAHGRALEPLRGGLGLDAAGVKGALAWVEAAAAFPIEPPAAGDAAALEEAAVAYRRVAGLRLATGKSEAAIYYNEAGKLVRPLLSMAALACDALADGRRGRALGLLREFVALAADARAASGSLTFADVAAIALRTLETDLTLRDWYKSRYDAIMVDEFQDDNELQKRVLYCLAERRDRTDPGRGPAVGPGDLEPGVLFFVGDEKQSIYKFRGADVTVFRGLAAELASAPGGFGGHGLDVNWRSEPGLIDFFNATFARVMPAPDDASAQPFEARFSALGSGPATPGAEPAVVYLESNEPDDGAYLPSGEAEAWRIAELARSLVDEGRIVAAKGPDGRKVARPCRWEDIAILFRSTASQNVVERYLRLLGVPYTAASTAGLYAESILGDLYAMLRLAVYPDDRLALAAVLRGPFARLSDDSVFALLSGGEGGVLDCGGEGLPPDDRARLAAARETWLGLRAKADREPLRALVEYLWYERGLRWNALKDPQTTAFLEHFDYAWTLAAAADARGDRLVDLVSSLEPTIGRLDRFDESVSRESSRGVSLMTVHLSKGLEFPVVILPDLDSTGRNGARSPVETSGRFGPSMRLLGRDDDPADPIAELCSALRKHERGDGDEAMDEELAETTRLFYVACTRAVSRLYLVGKVPRSADASGRSFRGLFTRAWPWAGPASLGDEEFLSDRPDDAPPYLRVEYVPLRAKQDYGRLVASGLGGGAGNDAGGDDSAAALMAASATATVRAVPRRRGRWAVTQAAERIAERLADRADRAADEAAVRLAGPLDGRAADASAAAADALLETEFGTLCHQFVEALLARPEEPPDPAGPAAAALARLPKGRADLARAEALALAERFVRSERGRAAIAARSAKPSEGAVFEMEYPFVWRAAAGEAGSGAFPTALTGSIDLVYGDGDGLWVVDFKTDRVIDPSRHAFQLAVYRDAAEAMFGRPTRAVIYYMRHGEEREIVESPDLTRLQAEQ